MCVILCIGLIQYIMLYLMHICEGITYKKPNQCKYIFALIEQ